MSQMLINEQTETEKIRQNLIDALPHLVFVVDEDVRILMANATGLTALGGDFGRIHHHRAGQAFSCLNAHATPGGCGCADLCRDCAVRNGVKAAYQGNRTFRHRTKMTLKTDQGTSDVYIRVTAGPLEMDGQRRALLTLEDVSDVIDIKGLVPICAHCKKIRVESQFWQRVEEFFTKRLDVNFTHGLCPECMEQYFPGMSTAESNQPVADSKSAL